MSAYRYDAMIGVGGIGTGSFFLLEDNATLGREESRLGRFIDRRDYCKLHIIAHYVRALLGADLAVIPVGKVGDDDPGTQLLDEMREADLDLRYVERVPDAPTLFSFCFVYPDGSGGNMTTADSACSQVDAAYVRTAEPEFARFEGRGIALAAPEVPLEARREVLQLGTTYGFLRVASFASAEIAEALASGTLSRTDLLALNVDEAAAVAAINPDDSDPERVVRSAVGKLRSVQPRMLVSVTAGARGSWSWDGSELRHLPVHEVDVASAAGAGDAHLAGIIAGLTAGLSFADAHQLGALVAEMSVTSPHTINKEVTRQSLASFAERISAELSPDVWRFLR